MKGINKSGEYGGKRFATRADYEEYFVEQGAVQAGSELWKNEEFVRDVQNHWHASGQNGCLFAQVLAGKPAENGWKAQVFPDAAEQLQTPAAMERIDEAIEASIADPSCEVMTFLFPAILTSEDLAQLLAAVRHSKHLCLSEVEVIDGKAVASLRIDITGDGVLAWVMGFGPFDFFPNTRRAPVTELTFRPKVKQEPLYEKLSKDQKASHTADVPLRLDRTVMDRLWDATFKLAAQIIGHKPDRFSAAKTTFSLPLAAWEMTEDQKEVER